METDIQLGNYKGLKAKKNEIKANETEISESLDFLKNSRAKIITVNRPAQKNDRVEIDFEVRHAGVRLENATSINHPLILGKGKFIPGFEEEIENMLANEEKEFSLKAPGEWPDKKIANKNLDFKIKLKLVQRVELPELDDEFAKSLGKFNSIDELKKSIKEGITQEKEIKEKQRLRLELIKKVVENSKMEVSEELIEQEKEAMVKELKASVIGMGLEFEKYLEQINTTIEELKKNWQEQAEQRVKIGLCLKAIANKEKIEVFPEEITQRINEEMKNYPDLEQLKKDIDLEKLQDYTKNLLINEKVFELLEKEAIIT